MIGVEERIYCTMPVKNLAVDVVTATRETPIGELARLMDDERLGDLVIAEDDRPVGIVTDRDIALAVARNETLEGLTAEDIMSRDPVTIHEDATAVDLPARMAEGHVRRIPVVDEDGKLVGIATLDDVVATVGEMLDDIATVIEYQSREYSPDE
jgi:CBS domain-containing protein